jgi:hypothetical protein
VQQPATLAILPACIAAAAMLSYSIRMSAIAIVSAAAIVRMWYTWRQSELVQSCLKGLCHLPCNSCAACGCWLPRLLLLLLLQANALIEAKKQQLAEARVWRQQQEEYEVCGRERRDRWLLLQHR